MNSPIFGETRIPTDTELKLIKQLVEDVPVGVFGILNKKLNELGFAIKIDAL